MQHARQGHLCVESTNAPNLPSHLVEEGKGLEAKAPIIRDGNRYYLQKNWFYETYLLQKIKEKLKTNPTSICDAKKLQEEILRASLLPKQLEAIQRAIHCPFTIINGGPGTGKTYTAAILVKCLKAAALKKLKIYLAAPTGKAASHLKTVIGDDTIEATTLHRLLRVQPGSPSKKPKHIDADLVIIDEASMLDVPLLAKIFEAIGAETRIVLMGDPDQLPPIEAGSIFREMATLFGSALETPMRAETGSLRSLAESINQGLPIEASDFPENPVRELFIRTKPVMQKTRPDPDKCLASMNQFRILGALRQGQNGSDAINREMLKEMSAQIEPGHWWAVPIMVTKNTPDLDLYNGSSGVLIGKSFRGLNLRDGIAYFPERIPYTKLPSFEIAFCLSIHKAQGSEFDAVLALFPKGSENFGKEALYTAVTRAKKRVEIWADSGVTELMLQKKATRTSGFTARF